jgi:hypothetical protein
MKTALSPPEPCTFWKDALASENPDRIAFDAHVGSCPTCSHALSNVAKMTSRLVTWSEVGRAHASVRSAPIGRILKEQRRRDAMVAGFLLTQWVVMQIGGGAFGSHTGNQGLAVVAGIIAVVVAARFWQRRSLLESFATETLAGHLRVTTRSAERRAKWFVGACAAWVIFCLAMIPIAVPNPFTIVWWLREGTPRLLVMAIWPAIFAVYTSLVTIPRLAALREELERT